MFPQENLQISSLDVNKVNTFIIAKPRVHTITAYADFRQWNCKVLRMRTLFMVIYMMHRHFVFSLANSFPMSWSTMKLYTLSIVLTVFISQAQSKLKRGKSIVSTRNGDISIKINRKKWENPKERLLCCPLAKYHCKKPCAGVSCE